MLSMIFIIFQSMDGIINASRQDITCCAGFGPQKVRGLSSEYLCFCLRLIQLFAKAIFSHLKGTICLNIVIMLRNRCDFCVILAFNFWLCCFIYITILVNFSKM